MFKLKPEYQQHVRSAQKYVQNGTTTVAGGCTTHETSASASIDQEIETKLAERCHLTNTQHVACASDGVHAHVVSATNDEARQSLSRFARQLRDAHPKRHGRAFWVRKRNHTTV